MFSNFETAILERLRAKLDSSIKVTTIAELSRVPELRQKAPAVMVIFEGYAPAAMNENIAHIQQVEMKWAVVSVVKNATGGGNQDAAKAGAGELANQILTALLGYDVSGGKGVKLRLTAAPGPDYDGGFCYMPIGFSCRATFKGDPV